MKQATSHILLESFRALGKEGVQCLLLGGQACVLYGAKTSTIDIDITLLITPQNIDSLLSTVKFLQAEPSPASVPPLPNLLLKGHSLHYYCKREGFNGIRLDVLGSHPQLSSFEELWKRRFEYRSESGVIVPVLSIPDLIQSKKTGRIKDTADITALVNSHYVMHRLTPEKSDIELWLKEAREVDILSMFVEKYPSDARRLVKVRPLIKHVFEENTLALKKALMEEAFQEATSHEQLREPIRKEAREITREQQKKKK